MRPNYEQTLKVRPRAELTNENGIKPTELVNVGSSMVQQIPCRHSEEYCRVYSHQLAHLSKGHKTPYKHRNIGIKVFRHVYNFAQSCFFGMAMKTMKISAYLERIS